MQDKLPNLFVVGAAKAGTTSLYNYLRQHPNIFVSPIKEPNYFGSDIDWNDFGKAYKAGTELDFEKYFSSDVLEERHNAFLDSEENYLKLFEKGQRADVLAEFSTSYLYSKFAAREIYAFNPQAKIIILVREPVSRTFSHFFMDVMGGRQTTENVFQSIKDDYETGRRGYGISSLYIDMSLYHDQIERYLDVFPRDQVLIASFEQLLEDKTNFMNRIIEFSGLSPEVFEPAYEENFNATLLPKNGLIKILSRGKKFIPKPLKKMGKQYQALFFEKRTDDMIPEDAKEYVENAVLADWLKTNKLAGPEISTKMPGSQPLASA